VTDIFVDFAQIWSPRQIFVTVADINFKKIRPVATALLQADKQDGQADLIKPADRRFSPLLFKQTSLTNELQKNGF
jgi:hypothetical protein